MAYMELQEYRRGEFSFSEFYDVTDCFHFCSLDDVKSS
jgi:hypothetical protein